MTNFLRDCTEGVDWIKEKKMDLGGHDHHDQWQKASALSQELAANQSRLDKIRNDGKYVYILGPIPGNFKNFIFKRKL